MTRGRLMLATGLIALTASPVAMAHVEVLPSTAVKGESTEFTVRVPAEEGLTTTQVRVTFPTEVSVYAIADAPGWTTKILKRPDGRIGGVIWSGGAITPSHYANFTFLGTPFSTGSAVFPSWQTTSSGKVKRWTGPPEAPGAASAETGVGAPGPAAAVTITETAAEAAPAGDSGSSGGGLWLGVIAIAASLVALAGVGLVWASRPRDLPPDGPEDRR